MIQIKFYTFNKRTNSTKVPTGSGSTYNCTLKDDTSILEPVIRLQTSNNVKVYNYAYIADFGRYYFVTDVVSSKGFWEISLKVDTLASEKTGIGAMAPYVLRAASESDEYILDTAYPADSYITEYITNISSTVTSGGVIYNSTTTTPFRIATERCYVLGIIGIGTEPLGSVNYYAMTQSQLNGFMGYLFGMTSTWSDISTSDYSDGVQRALLNPMQYIVSAIMLPFSALTFSKLPSNLVDSMHFGTYEYSGTGVAYALEASDLIKKKIAYMLMPSHPQASTRGKYLNGAPYSKYWLHLGPYGDIPLNGNLAPLITAGATDPERYITCEFQFDCANGICEVLAYDGLYANINHSVANLNKRLASVSFQAGIPIQLAQAYTDPLAIQEAQFRLLGTAAGSVAGGMTNPIGSAIGSLASIPSAVGDIMRAQYPTVSSTGANGSLLQGYISDEDVYIRSEHNRIVPENNTDLGRPLCQVKTINTLSGFVLCSGADYGGAGTSQERDEINGYLNGGFFYE